MVLQMVQSDISSQRQQVSRRKAVQDNWYAGYGLVLPAIIFQLVAAAVSPWSQVLISVEGGREATCGLIFPHFVTS